MEKYSVMLDVPVVAGKTLIRRVSDNLVARCKMSYLSRYGTGNLYVAASKTKAIRLDGLDWATEE